ncbi:hypothetical protein CKA32_001091 [Geitlerinema sp. FC II]|nr:hypothetical protein CKA32_001091 [Geitlerinema sp. FC II]
MVMDETTISGSWVDWLTVIGYLSITGVVIWRVLFAKS